MNWMKEMSMKMRDYEDEKPRTFHNLECIRLTGGECDCKMATTFTPPRHYTPIDGIRYTYERRPSDITKRVNGDFVQVFDGDDLIDEYPLHESPPWMGEEYDDA